MNRDPKKIVLQSGEAAFIYLVTVNETNELPVNMTFSKEQVTFDSMTGSPFNIQAYLQNESDYPDIQLSVLANPFREVSKRPQVTQTRVEE